jgi:hypothetical protein
MGEMLASILARHPEGASHGCDRLLVGCPFATVPEKMGRRIRALAPQFLRGRRRSDEGNAHGEPMDRYRQATPERGERGTVFDQLALIQPRDRQQTM